MSTAPFYDESMSHENRIWQVGEVTIDSNWTVSKQMMAIYR